MIKVYEKSTYYLLVDADKGRGSWIPKIDDERQPYWWPLPSTPLKGGILLGEIEKQEDLPSTLKMWRLLND